MLDLRKATHWWELTTEIGQDATRLAKARVCSVSHWFQKAHFSITQNKNYKRKINQRLNVEWSHYTLCQWDQQWQNPCDINRLEICMFEGVLECYVVSLEAVGT